MDEITLSLKITDAIFSRDKFCSDFGLLSNKYLCAISLKTDSFYSVYLHYCAHQQQTLYGPLTCHVGFEVCRKYNKYTRNMNSRNIYHLLK